MAEERVQRRLAAILAADVSGYSRLIEADEKGTCRAKIGRRSTGVVTSSFWRPQASAVPPPRHIPTLPGSD